LSKVLRSELDMRVDNEFFWTDSEIVLEITEVDEWHHVDGVENPADIASRGLPCNKLADSIWFTGPSFPKNEVSIQERIDKDKQATRWILNDDPEVRKMTTLNMKIQPKNPFGERFKKFSNWENLVRSIAALKECARNKQWHRSDLRPTNLEKVEEFILQATHKEYFPTMEREASLRKLNPKLDNKGVLRVGGRARAGAKLTETQIHPVILPKNAHVSDLILQHHNEKIHHLGRRSTLTAIREAGYWLINGTGQVKRWLHKCVGCRRLRRETELQQMGELPKERLEQTPAFTHVGIDVFEPYYVKDRRTELKCWGLMITRLYSRTVHIELLEMLHGCKRTGQHHHLQQWNEHRGSEE